MVVKEGDDSPQNIEMAEADQCVAKPKPKKKSENADKPEEPIYTVRVLKLIKEVQQQHGLRHSDYQRYRCYCTRRIRRLRKTLNLPPSDRHNFKKKTNIDEQHVNDKTITIPLMLAERAWSCAMQLRLEANTEPRKKFHLVNRLRKATKYALQLQQLCESPKFDSRTKLEAEAYVAWIHGTLHFELQLWNSAIGYFKKAQMVYERLAAALNEEDALLYRQKSEEITPSLRYCAYNLGEATASEMLQLRSQAQGELLKNLDVLVDQTIKHNANVMNEIKWRNRSFPVKTEKVRAFLLADRDLEKSFINGSITDNINLLEQHLMDCKDALTAARDDCKNEAAVKAGAGTAGENVSSTQLLLHYLSYIRLNRTIQRNLLMIEIAKQEAEGTWAAEPKKVESIAQRSKPQDLTRLYEIIIQNLMEMEQLPVSEYDPKYSFEIQSKIKAYQAIRCYYIGENLSAVGRWSDTVKLFERAAQLADMSLKSDCLEPNVVDELKALVSKVESSRIIVRAKSIFEPESNEQAETKKPALIDRIDEYYEDPSLVSSSPRVVDIPPPMIPIPCKPVFFDLALDMVKFPSLKDKVTGRKGASTEAGIKGFVKGLWGWKKN